MYESLNGKRVLLTGHTGFKGTWMTVWLNKIGAKVYGISNSKNNFFPDFSKYVVKEYNQDIRSTYILPSILQEINPQIVIHFAAQPIVSESYINPAETFGINVGGTLSLFDSLVKCKELSSVLVVTTDKVYKHPEKMNTEEDEIGGAKDPYSYSKACVELVVESYRQLYKDIKIATARGGNVIGGGDFGKDRIIPDCVRAAHQHKPMYIRNPTYTRPWQYVLDLLNGYLKLLDAMEKNLVNGGVWNFGPSDKTYSVIEVVKLFGSKWSDDFKIECGESKINESPVLNIDSKKSLYALDWENIYSVEQMIEDTVNCYKSLMFCNFPFDEIYNKFLEKYLEQLESNR